ETRFNLYDTTSTTGDTGVTLRRNFVVDLGVGGLFPFCSQPSCLDLRLFLGAVFSHQKLTTAIDETSVGGGKQELGENKLKPSVLFGTLLSLPIASSVRLQLGFLFRSLPSVNSVATSASGRTYTTTIDG